MDIGGLGDGGNPQLGGEFGVGGSGAGGGGSLPAQRVVEDCRQGVHVVTAVTWSTKG